MTTAAANKWRAAGKPVKYAQPIADLAATLRRHGYTVGTIGNDRHLNANPPEDHTPFSATGWPVASPYPYVHALDVMPPPAHSGLPSLVELGARLVNDRNAGVAGASWIKYVNWTNGAGKCLHEKWTPRHVTSSSNDVGHIHVSCRSDYTHSAVASGYDPVAHSSLGGAISVPPFVRELRSPMVDPQVGVWQRQMASRGWKIAVDNSYGPASVAVCRKFQGEKGLSVDGIVGPATWRASWLSPVT